MIAQMPLSKKRLKEDYSNIINVAKRVSENVVVSGLLPRLNDKHHNIQKSNAILEKLANDENCHYVNNELSFKLLNGSVNILFLV